VLVVALYFDDLLPYVQPLLHALGLSVLVTMAGMAAGCMLGMLLYLGKIARVRVVTVVSSAYIEVIRNTPLLVQLYLIYFGLPQVGINLDPLWSTLIGLTLNNAAYAAEIYRAGFEAVPNGLREDGRALGMRSMQVFTHVLLLPATKNVFPALTNQLILLFLASSIASIITLPELMNTILGINAQTYRTFEVLIVGGLMYFVVSAIIAFGSRILERTMFGWAERAHV